jgi:hypothetical protein
MWSWADQIDRLMQSASLPMWSAIAAAIAVALFALLALSRSERGLANAMLAVVALVALAGAVWLATMGHEKLSQPQLVAAAGVASPAPPNFAPLACLDGLAGVVVETACERVLFASPDAVAAAVSYTAAQIARLRAMGAAQSADLVVLRRAIEQDRFGLVAHVLDVRDRCTPDACDFFRLLENPRSIAANLAGHTYGGLVARYAASWSAAGRSETSAPQLSAMPGKPAEIDFPSASSIPPVSIMTGEPPQPQAAPPRPPGPPSAASKAQSSAAPSAAKPPRRPKAQTNAPVPITPRPPNAADDN